MASTQGFRTSLRANTRGSPHASCQAYLSAFGPEVEKMLLASSECVDYEFGDLLRCLVGDEQDVTGHRHDSGMTARL